MLECLILGDSISQGINTYLPECQKQVKVGISSPAFNKWYIKKSSNKYIVSLGSNDFGVGTYNELLKLRKILDNNVVWIVPNKNQREAVFKICNEFKDTYIDISKTSMSKDKVHPTQNGYKEIAKKAKENK